MARTGRPTSYREEYVEQVRRLAMLGLTRQEMAKFFGVAESTFGKWAAEIPEFSAALKFGREEADANVVVSLYRRALGYSHDSEDIRTVTLPGGMGSEVVKTPIVKHYPPDTVACIYWLKNRQPSLWRDRPEGGNDGTPELPVKVVINVKDAKADE